MLNDDSINESSATKELSAASDSDDLVYFTGTFENPGLSSTAFNGTISSSKSATAQNLTTRTAVPSVDVSSSSALYEYFIEATTSGGLSSAGTVTYDDTSVTYYIGLKTGYEWTITGGVRSKSNGKIIMSASTTKKITAASTTFSENFILIPSTTGTGSIDLMMTVDDSSVASLDVDWGGAFTPADTDTVSLSQIKISSIPSGVYSVTLNFKDSNDVVLYSTHQSLNVFANAETNKWLSGSSGGGIIGTDGTFKLTSAIINTYARTHYYVGDTGIYKQEPDDSNSGSPYEPLSTLGKALSLISENGTSDSDYTIYLSGVFKEGNDINLSANSAKSLTIAPLPGKEAVINGSDSDNGTGNNRCLLVDSPVPITIKDITISNGNSGNGAGIYKDSTGKLTLTNCKFVSNLASGTSAAGGAIYVASGEVEATSCEFKNNSAPSGTGGAIYIKTDSSITLCSFTSCTFTKNTATQGGAFQVAAQSGSNASVSDSTLTENEATESGGAIAVTSNKYFTVKNCTISGNKAPEGAGIYTAGKLTLENGEISGNIAASTGGGISCKSTSGQLFFSAGTITENTAEKGAGVYLDGSTGTAKFTMSGGYITKNTATDNDSAAGGGGVFVTKGNFTMSGGEISSNTANLHGGGVMLSDTGEFKLTGGTIKQNSAGYYGGGIYSDGTFNLGGTATIEGISEKNNDIYLKTGKTINFTSKVSSSSYLITPEDYIAGTKILEGMDFAANCSVFHLTDDSTYIVSSVDGTLKTYLDDVEAQVTSADAVSNADVVSDFTTLNGKNIYFKTSAENYGIMSFSSVSSYNISWTFCFITEDGKSSLHSKSDFQTNWGFNFDDSDYGVETESGEADETKDFGIDGSGPYTFHAWNGAVFKVMEDLND